MQIQLLKNNFFPPLLREIYQPPNLLYVKGDAEILHKPQIALVGSRHPTPLGIETAHRFAVELSLAGWIVTSGLAAGIDGAAHRGAIDAKKPTIAVLAHGLDFIYPRRHQQLAQQILDHGGAIISEWPEGTPAHPAYFPQRNRIISGLSRGTLIIEATLKSGSLITARLAMEQNRDVFAVPGSIHSPQAQGCNWLINQGATLVSCVDDILRGLGVLVEGVNDLEPHFRGNSDRGNDAAAYSLLDSRHQLLLECVDFSPTAIESIARRSNLKTPDLSTMLLTLEVKGYIRKVTAGYLRIDQTVETQPVRCSS